MIDPRFFEKVTAGKPAPTTAGGASGYFSAPAQTLDPNLFDGNTLKSEVRQHILLTLRAWLDETMGVHDIWDWLHVWIAGSGVTYQWAASRGNGDLDVLFGIEFSKFARVNPGWRDRPEEDLAAEVNDGMKNSLWPGESQTRFGSQVYEVTYFWNPGTGSDIRNIHPYAAIDVVTGEWAVPPPQLTEDPGAAFPREWYNQADHDSESAERLTRAYNEHLGKLGAADPGSVPWHNAGASLNLVVHTASLLFNDIHLGRRDAFGPQGHGYGDYTNFRWQYGKKTGAVKALHEIANVGEEARKDEETALWGGPIDGADVALRRAAQRYRG